MARRIARDPIYSGRRFSAETIETCVRWVLRYVPEYERRWSRFALSPGSSWRMDETAVSVRGGGSLPVSRRGSIWKVGRVAALQ